MQSVANYYMPNYYVDREWGRLDPNEPDLPVADRIVGYLVAIGEFEGAATLRQQILETNRGEE